MAELLPSHQLESLSSADNRSVIRVLFYNAPPSVINCTRLPTHHPSPRCPYPGYCVEVIVPAT